MNMCSTSSSDSSSSDSSFNGNKAPRCTIKSERIKGPWSAEEDRVLTRLVEQHGARNWERQSQMNLEGNFDSNYGSNNNEGIAIDINVASGSMSDGIMREEEDALTTLTLAPPGIGGGVGDNSGGMVVAERRPEGLPAGFWDVMRDVIAREVRDYVSSTLSESTSGFH
ncbi:hypothetical protein OIU78_016093 [Salix suchowensis]|nr:hypothetical protein OIU78_016093 [Salix suchowensis]